MTRVEWDAVMAKMPFDTYIAGDPGLADVAPFFKAVQLNDEFVLQYGTDSTLRSFFLLDPKQRFLLREAAAVSYASRKGTDPSFSTFQRGLCFLLGGSAWSVAFCPWDSSGASWTAESVLQALASQEKRGSADILSPLAETISTWTKIDSKFVRSTAAIVAVYSHLVGMIEREPDPRVARFLRQLSQDGNVWPVLLPVTEEPQQKVATPQGPGTSDFLEFLRLISQRLLTTLDAQPINYDSFESVDDFRDSVSLEEELLPALIAHAEMWLRQRSDGNKGAAFRTHLQDASQRLLNFLKAANVDFSGLDSVDEFLEAVSVDDDLTPALEAFTRMWLRCRAPVSSAGSSPPATFLAFLKTESPLLFATVEPQNINFDSFEEMDDYVDAVSLEEDAQAPFREVVSKWLALATQLPAKVAPAANGEDFLASIAQGNLSGTFSLSHIVAALKNTGVLDSVGPIPAKSGKALTTTLPLTDNRLRDHLESFVVLENCRTVAEEGINLQLRRETLLRLLRLDDRGERDFESIRWIPNVLLALASNSRLLPSLGALHESAARIFSADAPSLHNPDQSQPNASAVLSYCQALRHAIQAELDSSIQMQVRELHWAMHCLKVIDAGIRKSTIVEPPQPKETDGFLFFLHRSAEADESAEHAYELLSPFREAVSSVKTTAADQALDLLWQLLSSNVPDVAERITRGDLKSLLKQWKEESATSSEQAPNRAPLGGEGKQHRDPIQTSSAAFSGKLRPAATSTVESSKESEKVRLELESLPSNNASANGTPPPAAAAVVTPESVSPEFFVAQTLRYAERARASSTLAGLEITKAEYEAWKKTLPARYGRAILVVQDRTCKSADSDLTKLFEELKSKLT